MIEYYLRPDGAYMRIDRENKIVTNVLAQGEHRFIGHNTNPGYVDHMISILGNLTVATEADFSAALLQARAYLDTI